MPCFPVCEGVEGMSFSDNGGGLEWEGEPSQWDDVGTPTQDP